MSMNMAARICQEQLNLRLSGLIILFDSCALTKRPPTTHHQRFPLNWNCIIYINNLIIYIRKGFLLLACCIPDSLGNPHSYYYAESQIILCTHTDPGQVVFADLCDGPIRANITTNPQKKKKYRFFARSNDGGENFMKYLMRYILIQFINPHKTIAATNVPAFHSHYRTFTTSTLLNSFVCF